MSNKFQLRDFRSKKELALDFNRLLQLNQDPQFEAIARHWHEKEDFMAVDLRSAVRQNPDLLLVTNESGHPLWWLVPSNQWRLEIIREAFHACQTHHAMYQLMWSPETDFRGDIVRIAAFNASIDNGETFHWLVSTKKALEHPGLDQSIEPERRIFHPLSDEKSGNLALYLLSLESNDRNYLGGAWFDFLNQEKIINQLKRSYVSEQVNGYLNTISDYFLEKSKGMYRIIDKDIVKGALKLIEFSSNLSNVIKESNNNKEYIEKLINISVERCRGREEDISKTLSRIYSISDFYDLLPKVDSLNLNIGHELDDTLYRLDNEEVQSIKDDLKKLVSLTNIFQSQLDNCKEEKFENKTNKSKHRMRI